jgi:hypothetical protein
MKWPSDRIEPIADQRGPLCLRFVKNSSNWLGDGCVCCCYFEKSGRLIDLNVLVSNTEIANIGNVDQAELEYLGKVCNVNMGFVASVLSSLTGPDYKIDGRFLNLKPSICRFDIESVTKDERGFQNRISRRVRGNCLSQHNPLRDRKLRGLP